MTTLYINFMNNDHRTTYFKTPDNNTITKLKWKTLEGDIFLNMQNEEFTQYLTNENIKVIICFVCFENLINNYKKFLTDNNIFILVYVNDLHNKNNTVNPKKENARNLIHNFENVYICANYYYCYLDFYKIDPKRIIKYPTFVDENYFVHFNTKPTNKILLSGTKTKEYPARKKLNEISANDSNIDVLTNGIYLGHDYIKYLSKYLCCFTCCSNKSTPYIIGKFFEIPSSGSLLFAYDELVKDELSKLGFVDGVNYIGCRLDNMKEKISFILNPDNLEKINEIRKNGYDFVWKYHKQSDRLEYINEFISENLIR